MHYAYKNNTNNWSIPRLMVCGYTIVSAQDTNGFAVSIVPGRDVSNMPLS